MIAPILNFDEAASHDHKRGNWRCQGSGFEHRSLDSPDAADSLASRCHSPVALCYCRVPVHVDVHHAKVRLLHQTRESGVESRTLEFQQRKLASNDQDSFMVGVQSAWHARPWKRYTAASTNAVEGCLLCSRSGSHGSKASKSMEASGFLDAAAA